MEKEDLKKMTEDADYSNDLISFFNNFLKDGVVIKEDEVVPGFKVKLKVLNTEELLLAESLVSSSNSGIPIDIIQKIRAASILAQSIISINDILIEVDGATQRENYGRRNSLYKQIIKMPPIVTQKAYELYIEAVKEQNEYYKNAKETADKMENF